MKLCVAIEQDENGQFIASCPAISGCWSQGNTREEAITNINDALNGYFQSLEKSGDEEALLSRITTNSDIFGGKPIIRGRRLAVEHLLDMLVAGDSAETLLTNYPWLDLEDVQACGVYAYRFANHEFTIIQQAMNN